jgi:hypothetical protein
MAYIVKLPPRGGGPRPLQQLSYPLESGDSGDNHEKPALGSDYSCRRSDPYWQRAQEALRCICRHPYLPGTMRWLERANPWLYRRLHEVLPGQIGRLWDMRAPLDKFQGVLDRWVNAHREACSLYQAHTARQAANRGAKCRL